MAAVGGGTGSGVHGFGCIAYYRIGIMKFEGRARARRTTDDGHTKFPAYLHVAARWRENESLFVTRGCLF